MITAGRFRFGYEGGLNMISKYGLGRRLQGLSGVGIVCV